MFDEKYENIVFSLIMSLLISAIMSFAICVINLGLVEGMFFIWLNAYWKSFVLAFPITYIITPTVKRFTHKLVRS